MVGPPNSAEASALKVADLENQRLPGRAPASRLRELGEPLERTSGEITPRIKKNVKTAVCRKTRTFKSPIAELACSIIGGFE